jgi:hypothetical protein
MLPRTTDICTCTWKQGVWWSCGEQRYVFARTCADSRYVCEVCGEQKCCLTESPGEVVVAGAGGREIMDSTKSHKRRYWLSGPFAFLQEEHTHFALLLLFGRPVLTDTPKENNCALCQTPLSGICCLIWYGDFYFFNWPTSFIRETDNKLTSKHQGRRIWFCFLVYISLWRFPG